MGKPKDGARCRRVPQFSISIAEDFGVEGQGPSKFIVFLILCTWDLGVRNVEKTFPYKVYFGGQFKRHGDVEKRGFGMLKGCS